MRVLGHILLTTSMFLTGYACSPKVETAASPAPRAGTNDPGGNNGDQTKDGPGGGGTATDPKQGNGSKEGEDFFNGKIVAAFRDASETCLGCHNAPREVLGVPDASDERIYDYGKMFSLLKKGDFSNDNEFINPMLGKTEHPGEKICVNEETDLCALAIEWYALEFAGAAASSVGLVIDVKLQGVDNHVVGGYAKDIENVAQKMTVKAYMGGDKDNGTLIGEVVADKFQSSDIGNHAFQIPVPADRLDNRSQQVYVYAVKNGVEEPLGGSPISFMSYRQNNAFPGLGTLNINGCGCHTANDFNYNTLWPDLATPTNANAAHGPTNNRGYELTQEGTGREVNHPGGAVGSGQAYINWWCAEFNVDNNVAGCPAQ
ncbi:MAG: hypothetical protein HRU19_17345 [Pseudobacteriovorax sp.]|nr:hypothetical protein [Pseudobacteriovorax sp.]